MRRTAVLAAALLAGCGATDDGARAVLDRTKTTTATFASYGWMIARDEEGNNEDGWSSEFHQGDWHRIENPLRRVLANCRTHEAYIFEISTGRMQRNDDAWSSICGIYDPPTTVSVVRLPTRSVSRYGALDAIRITDDRNVRTYQIDDRGVIVRASWLPRNGSPAPCLNQEPIAVLSNLPSRDIFTEASLAVEATPRKYQSVPALPPAGLSGKRCGG